MATDYTKHAWVNMQDPAFDENTDPKLNATNLNEMESGIDTAHSELATHEADAGVHLTSDQNAAIDGATAPSVTNVLATMDDITASSGDMLKSKYDTGVTNVTDVVDTADALLDSGTAKTYSDIESAIDADIATHAALTGAHHSEAHLLGSHTTDTLANLNAKVTDATLIDTGDSRLSDARAPTAHASNHTDGTDDIQDATNAVKGLATAAQITALEAVDTAVDQSVISGASPTFNGANITNIDADTLIVDVKEANVSAITKGQVCAIVGSSGNKFEVRLCDCDDGALIRVIGIAAADTALNAVGQVVYKGLLTNVDTQITNTNVNPNGETWLAGDMLFVSNTAGGLSNVRPTSGRCIKAGRTLKGNSASDTLLAIIHTNDICACAAADEDLCNRMGDSAGVNKCSFKDYDNNEVAAFDSNGNLTLVGTVDGIDIATDVAANTAKVTNATHTGEVTGATELTIVADAVTYDKMQDVSATDKLLGRSTAGAGTVEEIACTAAGRALLDDVDVAAQLVTLGLTATLDELNYTDGVSSAIQTQLNAKAASGANSDITQLSGLTADLSIAQGGTGQSTAQAAIDALSAVSGATNEHVLTKDTGTGNAKWKAAAAGGGGAGITAESFSSSPAHLTTDQNAGKAFTIGSFPTHAQIKKISIRADFTAGQQSNTGSALINAGTGVAPADTSIVYDGESSTDLFAVDDQILIDSEWMDVTTVDTGTNILSVTRGIKGTMAAYHDDNAVITKGNHGVRLVLFEDSSKKYSERIIELSSMMTYKGVTDDTIGVNDDYFGLTGDIQNLGNGDFLVIEDSAEDICRVQNVNHNVANATYDYTIFVQDDLANHAPTKDVKKLIIFDLDIPYSSGAGILYGTVFVDEKIAATVNVKIEIETDSYT